MLLAMPHLSSSSASAHLKMTSRAEQYQRRPLMVEDPIPAKEDPGEDGCLDCLTCLPQAQLWPSHQSIHLTG